MSGTTARKNREYGHPASVRSSRAQTVTLDFVFSIGIFMAVLLILFPLWETVRVQLLVTSMEKEMGRVALGASSALVENAGQPVTWHFNDSENMTSDMPPNYSRSYGLAYGRNRLMYLKIVNLTSMNATNYSHIKEYLGAGKYELSVKLLYPNDTIVNDSGYSSPELPLVFGMPAPSEATLRYSAQVIERLVLINQSVYKVRVEVWKNVTT